MKVMIVGAGGQLGQALRSKIGVDRVVALSHAELDITHLGEVARRVNEFEPDVVINAAAFNDVDAAETKVPEAFALNAQGPKNLAIVTNATGVKLVHVSTDYVFDGQSRMPYHELVQPNPISTYGASKLQGELEVKKHHPKHFIVRTAWLYHIKGKNFPKTMLKLAAKGQVSVVNDRLGSPTYAPHLAERIIKLITTDSFGTYHMAGAGGASWFDLTNVLYRSLGLTTEIKPVSGKAFKQIAARPEYSVLRTVWGEQFKLPDWQVGVRDFVAAIQSTHAQLEAI